MTPSCASLAQGAFRALRRAAKGSAPGPRPLFCKKAGQKTFRRQSISGPNPSPLGRVIQSVREADTLAAEWQLPREWERRVGPETSRGRHHPKRFSLGLHPVSLGKTKEMGWNRQHNVKTTQDKTASSSHPKSTPPRRRKTPLLHDTISKSGAINFMPEIYFFLRPNMPPDSGTLSPMALA